MHGDSVTWESDAITPSTALLFPGFDGFSWFCMVSLGVSCQDPLMFSGTLRFNLDFQGHHTDEEIWAALRLARLEKQVMEMPLKLDEPVQEKLNTQVETPSWRVSGSFLWEWYIYLYIIYIYTYLE